MDLGNNLDFKKLQALNLRLHTAAGLPGSPVEGMIAYDSTGGVKHSYVYNGTAWEQASGSTGGLTNAYATVTDGSTPQASSGSDTLTVAASGTGLTVNTSTSKTVTYVLNSGLTGASKVLLLTAGGKITASVGQEVWALADLTDVTATTGTGSTVPFATGPTLTNPVIAGTASTTSGALAFASSLLIYGDGSASHTVVSLDQTQTLTGKTLTTPTIASFTNATHSHLNAAGGGPITAAAVSDFDTQVRTSTLNQMTAPSADLSINSHKLTNVTDPTNPQDVATKNYADLARQGLFIKDAVRVATAAALPTNTRSGNVLTASANGALIVDTVTVAVADRVLVKDEATGANNGIFTVTATGDVSNPFVLTRATDADVSSEVKAGIAVWVNEGSAGQTDTRWALTTNDPITLNTTSLSFTQDGGLASVAAGAGLTKTGNTLDVGTASSGRIVVNADNIDLASGIVSAGTYYGAITVDTYGRVTAADADLVIGNGVVARTSAGNYVNRAVTGTTNFVTVTNGDGVSGNPTITISTGYVGQTSITTLGTIVTGTWTGTTIAVANGGTAQTTAAGARGTSGLGAGTAATSSPTVTATSRGIARVVSGVITHDGSTTAFTITHNLGTVDVVVQIRDASDNLILVDARNATTNTTVVTWAAAQANTTAFNYTLVGY